MIYPYECQNCGYDFDVYKSLSEMNRPEPCPKCDSDKTVRYIARCFFHGEKVQEASYNPAFGKVINNKSHLREEMSKYKDQTGGELVEVGTEKVENIHRHAEKTQKERRENRWRKVSDELGISED